MAPHIMLLSSSRMEGKEESGRDKASHRHAQKAGNEHRNEGDIFEKKKYLVKHIVFQEGKTLILVDNICDTRNLLKILVLN